MKKLAIALAICLAVTSCFNRPKNKTEEHVKTEAELMAEAVVKIQLDSIAEEIGKLQPVGLVECIKNGEVILTDAEKAVKPDYLADPAYAKDLQTLSQKYRAVAILGVDAEVAKLYDMPTADYDAALKKLYADINDPAIKAFNEYKTLQVAIEKSYDMSKENGREYFFWEAATAALVEQAYIASRNIDKFIVAFDDKSASDFSYNVILLTDAIDKLASTNSEYAKLNESLKPLYKINALNRQEFRDQLESVKDEITPARAALME